MQVGPVGVGRACDVRQVVWRAHEGEPVGERFQGIRAPLNRYRVLVRDEIARTVDDPEEVDHEITTLIEALTN
jgi:hypothetical protein